MSDLKQILRKAFAAALQSGGQKEDAEDAVQEAFLRVHEYERKCIVRSKEAMLIKAAINVTRDEYRRRKRAPFKSQYRDLEQIFDRTPGPADVLHARARLKHAAHGLEQLSEKSRRILLARRLDDLSVVEIAGREDMTVAAVEKQIARATFKLMTWMEGW